MICTCICFFNFILGLNFLFFFFSYGNVCDIEFLKQRKIYLTARFKLNPNIYASFYILAYFITFVIYRMSILIKELYTVYLSVCFTELIQFAILIPSLQSLE